MAYIIGYEPIEDGVDTGVTANDKIESAFTNTQSAITFIDGRIIVVENALASIALNVLNAKSTATSQIPTAVDTLMQVEYGVIQGDGEDPIMIDAVGTITFNTTGTYEMNLVLTYGKEVVDTNSLKAFTRFTHNATQVGDTGVIALQDGDLISLHYMFTLVVESGDTLKTWLVRNGTATGGLFKSTILDWNDVPSAAMHVSKVA